MIDAAEDETARFLDLAGFADGTLDPDEHERVAEWLASDPIAAGDVAAARAAADRAEPVPEAVVGRACSLVSSDGAQADNVIPFSPRRRRWALHGVAHWGSLAAAMAVVGWLGFTLGMDTSRSVAEISQAGDEGFLQEIFDPSNGFLRDLTEGAQT